MTSNASNVTGTLNVLLAARDSGVRRVVFASSSSLYGASPTLPKHEDLPVGPISPYAVAKLAAESYCRSFWRVYQLETVALRYFNVFGPNQDPLSQYAAVIANFVAAALSGRSARIFGDGEQSRDFTYVDNVIDANLLAMNATGVEGVPINVACGERISLNRLVEELRDMVDPNFRPLADVPRPGDVRHSLADISRAEQMLGYRPTVDFREGLRRTVEHSRSQPTPRASVPVG